MEGKMPKGRRRSLYRNRRHDGDKDEEEEGGERERFRVNRNPRKWSLLNREKLRIKNQRFGAELWKRKKRWETGSETGSILRVPNRDRDTASRRRNGPDESRRLVR